MFISLCRLKCPLVANFVLGCTGPSKTQNALPQGLATASRAALFSNLAALARPPFPSTAATLKRLPGMAKRFVGRRRKQLTYVLVAAARDAGQERVSHNKALSMPNYFQQMSTLGLVGIAHAKCSGDGRLDFPRGMNETILLSLLDLHASQ